MTSNIVQTRAYYTCDHDPCAEVITDEQAIEQGGLAKAGWRKQFNETERKMNHFCPQHSSEEA